MALRISRRVCTLGRPRALGAGTKGSMWNHSASDKSVWYALLMLGTLPSHYLRTPFRTVSEQEFSETHTSMLGVTRCRRCATSRPRPRNVPPVNLPTRPLFWLSRLGGRRRRLIGRAKVGWQLLKHAGRREVLTAR